MVVLCLRGTEVRSDEELMLAHATGDPSAFRELFERHAAPLARLMLRDLFMREEANDLVQQAFLQLHRARFDFDPKQRLKPWLYTIALNLKREHFRRKKRRPEQLQGDDTNDGAVAPRGQERTEARRALAWALEQVPADQREVIELHWFGGLSFPEVSEVLAITPTAAKVRAHRGYVRLRELFEKDEALARNFSLAKAISTELPSK
jgi:RNA polymerase sigma factor (sigma-70 family)